MAGAIHLVALFAASQKGSPDEGGGIAIMAGVIAGAVVAFALIVWGLGAARRRWRTGRKETHRYGDVGRVAGAGETEPSQPERR
jgi:hypothetical protein